MDGLDGLLEFLNYGAAGVLSLAFLLMLWMVWRRGEKSDKAIDALTDKGENVECLMDVVKCNTAAMTSVCLAVESNTEAVRRLNGDLDNRLENMNRDIRDIRTRNP